MTDHLLHARLYNDGGELIAEGPCWLDEPAGRATLEPEHEPGVIQKERGQFTLELDSGRSVAVSDKPMIFRLGSGADGVSAGGRRSVYRLRLLGDSQDETLGDAQNKYAHDANAAGGVGEGSPAVPGSSGRLRENGETPAAS